MSNYPKSFGHHDKYNRLVDAVLTRNESLQALLEPSPGMKALQDSIDQIAGFNSPVLDAAKSIQDSIDQFADVTGPMQEQLANMSRVSDAFRESMSACGAFVPTRIEPEIFEPPLRHVEEQPQRPGPAQEVLQIIKERFDAEKAENKDRRHDVFIIVTLLDGSHLYAEQLASEGEHLIRIEGKDADLNPRSVTVGAGAIQYEIVTVELPPNKPDLGLVTE